MQDNSEELKKSELQENEEKRYLEVLTNVRNSFAKFLMGSKKLPSRAPEFDSERKGKAPLDKEEPSKDDSSLGCG